MSQEETGTSVNAENIAFGKSAIKKSSLSLAERLGLVGYRNQSRSEIKPHIVVDTDICNSSCPHQCTTWVCPANCYTWTRNKRYTFKWRTASNAGPACMPAIKAPWIGIIRTRRLGAG